MIQSKMFKKISVAFSALLMAGTLVACGGDEDSNNTSACAAGQVEVGAGSSIAAGCYDTCADGTACADGKTCKTYPGGQKLCVTDTATNNTTNNTNNDTCDTGKVKVSYEGSEQCMTDCATDASVCGATEECTSVGSNKVCTPAEQPACGDGEVETVYAGGTKSCYDTCTGDADCAADDKLCKTDDAGANMICVPKPPNAQLCADYCDMLYGACALTNCAGATDAQKQRLAQINNICLNGNGGTFVACEQRLAQDPAEKAAAEKLVAAGCDSTLTKINQCGTPTDNMGGTFGTACGCTAPDYSKGCTTDAECNSTAPAVCVPETNADAGNPPGGVCTVNGCHQFLSEVPTSNTIVSSVEDLCGEGGVCLVLINGGQPASSCFEACEKTSDCARGVTGADDDGYSCQALARTGDATYFATCQPACKTDADCVSTDDAGNMVQGVCGNTRVCEPTCDPALPDTDMQSCKTRAPGSSCAQNTRDNTKFSCHIPDSALAN